MSEEWKNIKGYEGLYRVSSAGRVMGLRRGKVLKPFPLSKNNPYLHVSLSRSGKINVEAVHLLVWDAFGDQPRNGRILQVDHKDQNKNENGIENLQLLTSRANISKGYLNKKTKASQYTGVSWRRQSNKWQAQIMINGTAKHLGYYFSEPDASRAYQRALLNV